ncbi:MAG: hypothetical protein IB618_03870 [Candidatus Pacearchaeota archaeon]|nr:MAG: hypothetical protein IB618_03870 [Candidatus Pacearchaeota archaeon]
MRKKAQFQFAWIFAVVVGAMILFLAFYFVGTTLLRQQYEQTTIETQSLDILLNPFAYLGSLGATTYNPLSLPEESEILMNCDKGNRIGEIGKNTITLLSKGEAGVPKIAYDKYIFTPQPIKGKNFEALSKPFEMPWRVADLIILWPSNQEYCFQNAPSRIENEIERLEISSIKTQNCSKDSIKVCFTGSCDIRVYGDSVEKKGKGKVYYSGDALMYAAIFSDPALYRCNLQRLASRIYSEALVYEKKSLALSQRGCDVSYNLRPIKDASEKLYNSPTIKDNVIALENTAQILKNVNNMGDCTLF